MASTDSQAGSGCGCLVIICLGLLFLGPCSGPPLTPEQRRANEEQLHRDMVKYRAQEIERQRYEAVKRAIIEAEAIQSLERR